MSPGPDGLQFSSLSQVENERISCQMIGSRDVEQAEVTADVLLKIIFRRVFTDVSPLLHTPVFNSSPQQKF